MKGCYWFSFGFIALAIAGILYGLIWQSTLDWHPYWIWLVSASGATFVLYGLDKMISNGNKRAPEELLHAMSLAGGFVGAGLGRILFDHKTNTKEHPAFPIVIWLSVIAHGLVIYYLFLRRI